MAWYVNECRITVNSGGGDHIYKAESYRGACTAMRYMFGLVLKGGSHVQLVMFSWDELCAELVRFRCRRGNTEGSLYRSLFVEDSVLGRATGFAWECGFLIPFESFLELLQSCSGTLS